MSLVNNKTYNLTPLLLSISAANGLKYRLCYSSVSHVIWRL